MSTFKTAMSGYYFQRKGSAPSQLYADPNEFARAAFREASSEEGADGFEDVMLCDMRATCSDSRDVCEAVEVVMDEYGVGADMRVAYTALFSDKSPSHVEGFFWTFDEGLCLHHSDVHRTVESLMDEIVDAMIEHRKGGYEMLLGYIENAVAAVSPGLLDLWTDEPIPGSSAHPDARAVCRAIQDTIRRCSYLTNFPLDDYYVGYIREYI